MARHDFLLSFELESVFDGFSDEQAGKLIKATFDYEKRRELTEFGDPLLQMMFDTVIRQKSDNNAEAYRLRCERQRANVLRRWEKGKTDTMVYDGKSGIPKIPPYTNDTKRTDIDIDIDKSMSIYNDEAKNFVEDFLALVADRKLSTGKKLRLLRQYTELRKTRAKEDVDRELLDSFAEE